MKAEELAVIKERADKATEGPWILSPEVCGPEGQGVFNVEDFGCICEVGDPYPRGNNRPQENMEFIANARQDIPKLVAEVERLREAAEYACEMMSIGESRKASEKLCDTLGVSHDYFEEELE